MNPSRLLFAFLFFCFSFSFSFAQFSRNNHKSNIPTHAAFQRVSSGSLALHTLEIRNGSLWAWGNNEYAQLGDGTTNNHATAIQIGSNDNWLYVATAFAHSIAIKSDGTLWAWGFQPWSGSMGNPLIPEQIGTDNNWISIAAGDSHNLALKSDGTLWTWGWNAAGELGLGNFDDTYSPVQVGSDNDWAFISAFSESSMAIKSNGTLWAWGYNASGELGIGSFADTNLPTQVGSDKRWSKISGGIGFATALQSNGSLWTWGNINDSNVPVQQGTDSNWVTIAGNYGIRANGTLWSWSNNNFNQLGSSNNWTSISSNYDFNLGMKADGSLWAWGNNDYGQLGTGNLNTQTNPVSIGSVSQLLALAAGQSHSLMLKSNGTLWAWGDNSAGQLGIGNNLNKNNPVRIGSGSTWVGISARSYNNAAIQANGSLWTWGLNDFGELGDGTLIAKKSPVRVGSDSNWVSVDVGDMHMLALKSDGSLWAWGKNSTGQLGIGSFSQPTSPLRVGSDNDWVSIAAGTTHSLAIKSNGTLWGWGWNASGEVGDNSSTMRTSPVQIGTSTNWVAVDAGDLFSLALKSDGTLWTWGTNTYGQLGTGNYSISRTPVQVGALHNWTQISAGVLHSAAIMSDGGLWTWGSNSSGQYGTGNTVTSNEPIRVGNEQNWILVTGGIYHTLATKANRLNYCTTGNNTYGQLGDFTNTDRITYSCFSEGDCVPPAAPAVSGVIPICPGTSITLTATGSGTIGWYNASSGGTWLGSGNNFTTPTLNNNTTYYVQDSSCAAGTRTAVTVTVNGNPPDAPGVYTQYICNGEPAILTAYGSNGGTISWYDAQSGGNYLGSGLIFTTQTLHATGDTLTSYYFYAQDSLCVSSATRTAGWVVVYPSFVPLFDSIGPLCRGAFAPSLPETSMNGVHGTWSPSVINTSHSAAYVFTPDVGNYLECNVPVTINITVVDTPALSILNLSGTTVLSCQNPSISLSASGGMTYQWNQHLGNLPDVTITQAGYFTVTATNSSGCASHVSIIISGSNETQSAPVISGPVNICRHLGTGMPVMFTVPRQAIPTIYTWTIPSNVTLVSGQGTDTIWLSFDLGFFNNRNKQIRVKASSNCGISDVYIHYLSAQIPSTPSQITGPKEVCANTNNLLPANYSINPIETADTFLWTLPPNATIVQHNGESVDVVFSNTFTAGSISVKAVNYCGVSAQRSITVKRTRPYTPGNINGPSNVCLMLPDSINTNGVTAVYKINTVFNAADYLWSVPSGAAILLHQHSSTEDSIVVRFDSFFNGNITVQSVNDCGVSEPRSLTLSRLMPGYPGEIIGPDDVCGHEEPNGTPVVYQTTAGYNRTFFVWNIPSGASNITGQGTNSISFLFPAGYTAGYISVKAINGCGSSLVRNKFVLKSSACRDITVNKSDTIMNRGGTSVHTLDAGIVPNPSISTSEIHIPNAEKSKAIIINIYDQLGRKIKSISFRDAEKIILGNEIGRGVYFISITQNETTIWRKMIRS